MQSDGGLTPMQTFNGSRAILSGYFLLYFYIFCIEIMDRHIYAIGGFFEDGITAAVEAFYLETKKWTQMSKLPTV